MGPGRAAGQDRPAPAGASPWPFSRAQAATADSAASSAFSTISVTAGCGQYCARARPVTGWPRLAAMRSGWISAAESEPMMCAPRMVPPSRGSTTSLQNDVVSSSAQPHAVDE
ncbi:hypothetical protein BC477_12305 [Clavibacter michiganensis subsp. michiganensis]|uniref:Uncharacterized protein n=1 Tax=Clavibacter michiganensis subsp. michiganensis TaxID=33013 RepID=A0A251XHS9_CLAMM|nr:hypothetical protein BC477_12305 [Clavibacter michiganensis subsp. michiganensis]OUE02579.1 hypothetical protein CMMCAS07_11215 [Clavibacter michiganensis subsp. michiganensis]